MIQTTSQAPPSDRPADPGFGPDRTERLQETRAERIWRNTLAALPAILLGVAALVWGWS